MNSRIRHQFYEYNFYNDFALVGNSLPRACASLILKPIKIFYNDVMASSSYLKAKIYSYSSVCISFPSLNSLLNIHSIYMFVCLNFVLNFLAFCFF
jgi:hypothetical protein